MLLSLPLILATAFITASFASAEIKYDASGTISYAKRFEPSSGPDGVCTAACPTFAPDQSNYPNSLASVQPQQVGGQSIMLNGVRATRCEYQVDFVNPFFGAGTRLATCDYNAETGAPVGQNSIGVCGAVICTPVGQERRALSSLEKVIRSRQYNPKKRSTSRRR